MIKFPFIFRQDIRQGELIVADIPLFIVPPRVHTKHNNQVIYEEIWQGSNYSCFFFKLKDDSLILAISNFDQTLDS